MRPQKTCPSRHQRTSRIHGFRRAPFSADVPPPSTPLSTPPDAPRCNKRIRDPPSLPDHTDSAHRGRLGTSPTCADAPDQASRTLPTPSGSTGHLRPSPPHTHPPRTQLPISTLLLPAPSPRDRTRKYGNPRAPVPAPAAAPETPEYRRSRP